MSKVEVRPLPMKKWHNKEGKDSFAQPRTIEALYDPETGRLATGLNEEEAKKYGEILKADLGNTFNGEAHPFYSEKKAWVTLPNHTIIFDTSKPMDFVKVKLIKASKFVANSMKEKEEGKWPDATHVIFDEDQDIELKATKVQLKSKAYVQAAGLSADGKAAIIQIIANRNVRGRTNDFIDVEIGAVIEDDPAEFLRVFEMGPDEVKVRAQILELLNRNVLTKEGSAIFYMGQQIGVSYEEAVSYFKDPNNQRMKVAILEKLQAKKSL